MTPALSLLLGPQAGEVLAAAVDAAGADLDAVRPANVHVQPSGAAVVRYAATVRGADGRRVPDMLVATTGDRIPAGAALVAGEHRGAAVEVGVWRWLYDPALPALAVAADQARLAAWLRDAGLTSAPTLRIRVRAYRPGRRAVVEADDGRTTWFVKVVRPADADALRARHELIGRTLPVPPVLAATSDGLLVLPRAGGTPLRAVLAADGQVPPPAELEALLDGLPGELMTFPRRRAVLHRVGDFAAVLRQTVDPASGVLDGLADLVAELSEAQPGSQAPVPVHGDFYEGQLLTEYGRVTGLLDVDTAGPGERADEWATMLAHLLAAAITAATPAVGRYAEAVLDHAQRRVNPRDLRRRTSAALLGLATGPFRVQQPQWERHTCARIALAREWLRADEKTLMVDFPVSHLGVRS